MYTYTNHKSGNYLNSFNVYLLPGSSSSLFSLPGWFHGQNSCTMVPWRLKPMTSPRGPTPQWIDGHWDVKVRWIVPVKLLSPVIPRNSCSGNTPSPVLKKERCWNRLSELLTALVNFVFRSQLFHLLHYGSDCCELYAAFICNVLLLLQCVSRCEAVQSQQLFGQCQHWMVRANERH